MSWEAQDQGPTELVFDPSDPVEQMETNGDDEVVQVIAMDA